MRYLISSGQQTRKSLTNLQQTHDFRHKKNVLYKTV